MKVIQKNPAKKNEEVLKSLNTCCICGHSLTFLHVTNFTTLQVKERAQCPACGIKMKESDYKLQ